MQTRQLVGSRRVNIAEKKHVFESILAPPLVAASRFECFWILERAEQHVPDRDVRKVVGVMTKLVMNPM
jgi:hypothetical protein